MKSVRASRKSAPAETRMSPATRIGWWASLAVLAIVPLVTSVTPARQALTADTYHLPKLMTFVALLTAVTVAWLFELWTGTVRMRVGRALIAPGVFAGLVLMSTVFGFEPVSSLFGASGQMTGVVTWLSALWFAFLLGQYVTSEMRLREASWATVSGGVAVSSVALLQAMGVDPLGTPVTPFTQWMVDQGLSTLGNPNYTGLYLIVPLVVALGLSFAEKDRGWRSAALAAAAITGTAAFITLTRAAWIGAFMGVAVLVALAAGGGLLARRRLIAGGLVALGLLAVGVLLASPTMVVQRLSSITGGLNDFSTGRLDLWRDVFASVLNRPLLGTGADRLALGVYEVQRTVVIEGSDRFVAQDPHSLPLLVAGVFGVPALIAFVWMFGEALANGWRRVSAEREPSVTGTLYKAWLAAAIGYLAASLLNVYTITAVIMVFVLFGFLTAPSLRTSVRSGSWPMVVATVFGVLLMSIALFGSVQSLRSSWHIARARIADSELNLQEAIRISPWDTRNRLTFEWRKIGAFRGALTSPDAALARQTADQFEAEIRIEIVRAPDELLWYRMLVDMFEIQKGTPAYRPDKVRTALELALDRFPDDTEFNDRLERLDSQTNP